MEPTEHDGPEIEERVEIEIRHIVERVPEVELSTVFQAVVAAIGVRAVPHIGEAVQRLSGGGVIDMEARRHSAHGHSVAWLRRRIRA